MSKYTSSKRFGPISTGHRQWRHEGHCSFIHGYGRYVEITFGCDHLDERNWVMDFGDLKDVKSWLENQWDHRVLIAWDDPLRKDLEELNKKGGISINVMPPGYGPGIEDSCKYVYDKIFELVTVKTNNRVWVDKVRVYEHNKNWAEYNG